MKSSAAISPPANDLEWNAAQADSDTLLVHRIARYSECVSALKTATATMQLNDFLLLKASSTRERRSLREELVERRLLEELQKLKMSRSPVKVGAWVTLDFLVITVGFGLASFSPLTFPLAMILVATRLRAIGNLLHDASHRNLFANRVLNDLIGRFVLAPAAFEGWNSYRKNHMEHHRDLGTPCDPDLIEVSVKSRTALGLLKTFLRTLFERRFWLRSVLVCDPFSPSEIVPLLFFWILLLSGISWLLSFQAAAFVLGFLLFTRATVFHALRVFWEMADHAFLKPESEIEFTRTMPSNSPLTWLLHPHNDNFHLAHHLFPSIPMANLKRAHEILLRCPSYAAGEFCESYLSGSTSVLASLCGRRYFRASETVFEANVPKNT
jgi:fatty acid desaturase